MKQEIMAWLTNPDATAEEGKQLYVKYGKNLFFMRILSTTNDPLTIKKALNNEFRLLIGINPLAKLIIPKAAGEVLTAKPTKTVSKDGQYSDPYIEKTIPPELEETYRLRDELYVFRKTVSTNNAALGKILLTIDEKSEQGIRMIEERCANAKLILETSLRLDEQWQIIHYYAANGKLPDPAVLLPLPIVSCDVTDPLQLQNRYRNLKTYISKSKKDIEKNREELTKRGIELNAISAIFSSQFNDNTHLPISLETFSTIRK